MSKMYRSCEEIRQELIQEVDDKARLIIQSYFDWHPRFEEKYLEAIQTNIEIFRIYRRWVLASQRIWSLSQEEALVLRAAALSRSDDSTFCSGTVSFDKAIVYLVMDIHWPLIHTSICNTIFYHSNSKLDENDVQKMMRSESDFENVILSALCSSLVCCDKITIGHIYLDFGIALQQLFITFLPNRLEVENLDLSAINDDRLFQKSIENEWVKLLPFADLMFGFKVAPRLGFPDVIRYLRLPCNPEFKKMAKNQIYRDINNYLIFSALVRPQPLPEINMWLRHELVELYRPLVERTLKRKQKSGALTVRSDDVCSALMKKIDEYSKEFEPFYVSFQGNPIKQGWKPKVSWLQQLIAPIGWSGRLVKIGSIFNARNEYPATAFFEAKILSLIDQWLVADENPAGHSYDDDTAHEGFTSYLPGYDFESHETGEGIGWLPKTFAGILGISYRTLKRWQSDGLLVGRQSDQKYQKFGGGKKYFKFYVEDDLTQAKRIREEKQATQKSGKKLK